MNTTAIPAASAQLALAERCGLDPRRGGGFYSMPGVLFDAFLCAVGANSYPSVANTERKLDAFGEVSAAYGISVDEVVRWSETWADALVVAA